MRLTRKRQRHNEKKKKTKKYYSKKIDLAVKTITKCNYFW